jgi:endonuclease III
MAATSAKTQILSQAFNLLKKKMPAPTEPEKRPIMEELIYAICREGVTTAEADQAFSKLKTSFFDWNEVRVSTVPEVSDMLSELPESGTRAKRIIEFLQELFEMTYAFNLDDLEKKGLKQASKQLSRYQAVSGCDYLVAWVVQRALGGHAIPLDEPALRVLKRLGVLDAEIDDLETARGSVEAAIVKAKGFEFTELLSSFASSVCTEARPACKTCPLKADCPTGQGLTSTAKKPAAKNDAKSETKTDTKPKKSR